MQWHPSLAAVPREGAVRQRKQICERTARKPGEHARLPAWSCSHAKPGTGLEVVPARAGRVWGTTSSSTVAKEHASSSLRA